MDSITIGWTKKSPGEVKIASKKKNGHNHIPRKIIPKRQPRTFQNREPFYTGTVRSNKQLLEDSPDTLSSIRNFALKPVDDSASHIQVFDDKRLCSVRAAIVTFVIAIALIIASGASIGIVFAVINSSHSSKTGSDNQDSYTTVTSGITSSIRIGSQTGSGCSGYTEINDPSRSINSAGFYSSCDNGPIFNTSNGGAWIRFVGTGGDRITTVSAGTNHCGGFLSGWYNDTLPTAQDVVTNGIICFDTTQLECIFTVSVSVIYCSAGYYVFFLPPISICNARYCTT
ncbi:unnamed protein product [Rotaria sp. Silwood2]|nr:unnamed protein product [Rotaria sp. Silwood2]CAF2970875.1 unnamed protein product [Rotaria sp. Silwood2]CAF4156101.1 unnamed protein product [Rotaria sp. Silwood2]